MVPFGPGAVCQLLAVLYLPKDRHEQLKVERHNEMNGSLQILQSQQSERLCVDLKFV